MRGFARFWYDFVIGDDWRIAAGVVTGLGLTALLTRHGGSGWWVLPVVVAVILAGSVGLEVRARGRDTTTGSG